MWAKEKGCCDKCLDTKQVWNFPSELKARKKRYFRVQGSRTQWEPSRTFSCEPGLHMHCITNSSHQPHAEGISVLIYQRESQVQSRRLSPNSNPDLWDFPLHQSPMTYQKEHEVSLVALFVFTKRPRFKSRCYQFLSPENQSLYSVSLFPHL